MLVTDDAGAVGGTGGDVIGHLDGVILGLGAPKRDVDIAVIHAGVDTDRIAGVVAELEVQRAPVDGGVHTQRHIGDLKVMAGALHDLQIGQQGTEVDGGSHLAAAAAELVDGIAADVDLGLSEAAGRRTLTHHTVEGEDLAVVDDGAVDLLAGQLQVDGAVVDGGMGGIIGSELVLEQVFLQVVHSDLGLQLHESDLQLFAFLRRVELLLHFLHIKAVAGDLLFEGGRLLVVGGVDGLLAVFIENLLEIRQIRLGLGELELNGVEVRGDQCAGHFGGKRVGIQTAGVFALGDEHESAMRNGLGRLFALLVLVLGLFLLRGLRAVRVLFDPLFKADLRLLELREHLVGLLVDQVAHRVLIIGEALRQVDLHRLLGNLGDAGHLHKAHDAAVIPRLVHGALHVQMHIADVGRDDQGVIGQLDSQVAGLINVVGGGVDLLHGGSLGQASHRDAGDVEIVHNDAAVEHEQSRRRDGQHQDHRQHRIQGGHGALFLFLLCHFIHRLRAVFRLLGLGALKLRRRDRRERAGFLLALFHLGFFALRLFGLFLFLRALVRLLSGALFGLLRGFFLRLLLGFLLGLFLRRLHGRFGRDCRGCRHRRRRLTELHFRRFDRGFGRRGVGIDAGKLFVHDGVEQGVLPGFLLGGQIVACLRLSGQLLRKAFEGLHIKCIVVFRRQLLRLRFSDTAFLSADDNPLPASPPGSGKLQPCLLFRRNNTSYRCMPVLLL